MISWGASTVSDTVWGALSSSMASKPRRSGRGDLLRRVEARGCGQGAPGPCGDLAPPTPTPLGGFLAFAFRASSPLCSAYMVGWLKYASVLPYKRGNDIHGAGFI